MPKKGIKDRKAKVTERKTEKDHLLRKLENEKEKRISSEKELRDKKIKVVQVKMDLEEGQKENNHLKSSIYITWYICYSSLQQISTISTVFTNLNLL